MTCVSVLAQPPTFSARFCQRSFLPNACVSLWYGISDPSQWSHTKESSPKVVIMKSPPQQMCVEPDSRDRDANILNTRP